MKDLIKYMIAVALFIFALIYAFYKTGVNERERYSNSAIKIVEQFPKLSSYYNLYMIDKRITSTELSDLEKRAKSILHKGGQ